MIAVGKILDDACPQASRIGGVATLRRGRRRSSRKANQILRPSVRIGQMSPSGVLPT
jgi:hypothetical protein